MNKYILSIIFFQDLATKASLVKELFKNEDSDTSLDKNFHARYGNNLLPLPPSISIPKISKVKH